MARLARLCVLLLGLCGVGPGAHALEAAGTSLPQLQDFPRLPIRALVHTSPGGLIDFTARLFADIARRHVLITNACEAGKKGIAMQ